MKENADLRTDTVSAAPDSPGRHARRQAPERKAAGKGAASEKKRARSSASAPEPSVKRGKRVAKKRRNSGAAGHARRKRRTARGLSARLRSSDARGIVLRSLLLAAVLVLALAVLAAFRPQLHLAKARRLVRSEDIATAEAYLNDLEREDYPEGKIAELRFQLVEGCLEQGDLANARDILEILPEGQRRSDLSQRTQYLEADDAYRRDQFESAAQLFYRLGDYGDSASRYLDSRCALIVRKYLSGDTEEALYQLYNLEESSEHIVEAIQAAAASEDEARSLLAKVDLSPDHIAETQREMQAMDAARDGVSIARVAAGYRHTVGLKQDGTVLATGDNSRGQCDVSNWTDIIQVAAGAMHTVGLRLDGTVVAVGDNTFGECEVSGWSDVTAVAANTCGTFGLRRDGTVLATGTFRDAVSGWRDASEIAAGSYSAGCVHGQGSMQCTHKGAQLDLSAAVSGLSVCGAVSAGLDASGALICSEETAPKWTDLRCVCVTQTGLLGVTRDGRALSYRFRDGAEERLSIEGSALEIAGGGTHCVVLTDRGRAFAFGDNESGQCNVGDWHL